MRFAADREAVRLAEGDTRKYKNHVKDQVLVLAGASLRPQPPSVG